MKPKDLKCPFKWEDRRPHIYERVLFVPEYYDRHQEWKFPGWESPEVFGRSGPIEVEYCTGNGAWIIEKAIAHPDRLWVAVERQFDRVRKIWSKMRNFNLTNLFIVCGEGLTFTQFYVPDRSFQKIYINFPDPWPKEKHSKNRLIKEPFISEIARAADYDATVTMVTDHATYMQQITESMRENPSWRSAFPDPYYVTEWEGYGTSYFDELWRTQGQVIHYMHYQKNGTR